MLSLLMHTVVADHRGSSIHVHHGQGDETGAGRELAQGSYWQEHSLAIAN